MSSNFSFQLLITLRSPLHVGTGTGLAQLIDAQTIHGPARQDDAAVPETPVPYLPASSIKGRLRWQMAEVTAALAIPGLAVCAVGGRCAGTPCAACLLFGAPNREGLLRLADAHLQEPELALAREQEINLQPAFLTGPRNFVALSRVRRVARPQQLARIQQVARGAGFVLSGSAILPPIDPTPGQPDPVRGALALFVAAVQSLSHLGGHKSRGLGWVGLRWLELSLDGVPTTPPNILAALPFQPATSP